MNPRIAVTGLGILTRFGTLKETWGAALEGRDGGVDLPKGLPVTRAALISARLEPSRHDRAVQLAVAAAQEAWREANPDAPSERRAVLIGTARGCVESIEAMYRDLDRISPLAIPYSAASCPASAVSIQLDCKGPTLGLTSACATALHAIGLAARLIQTGMADVALAGGTEACLTPSYVAMIHRSGIVSEGVCRPFDKRRDGILLGEGAGVLVLERWDRAVARGAQIRGELLGYGATNDAESLYAPAPDGGALAAAMIQALKESSGTPIAFVKAHGTATGKGDLAEARAIRAVLGDTPVVSLKPVIGHTIGASSGIESALALRALAERRIPPTANFEQPDPAIPLNVSAGAPRPVGPGAAMVNASAFGGSNGCLIFGAP